ncbi:MAG TPA: sensor domain-containing diguanylate cyclase [Candidatus Polarisedimenticolaceae bacterium]|nr:sensor domain-containing diguanylate cyclase [Candidatus Polarisedimenticolaceae bacterium]
MKILLALDDPSDRLFLSRVLLSRGDEAAVAMDLAGLQEQSRSGRFAAVLVGETFGGEDARAVVAGLHAAAGPSQPVLLVWCPQRDPAWRREAMAAGADDTLAERDGDHLALRLAVAERSASERARARDLRFLATAFEHAPDPLLVIAFDSATVRHANHAAAHLLGHTQGDLLGAPWSDLVPWSAEGEPPDPEDLLRDPSPRLVLRRGDGSLRTRACRAVPVPWGEAGGVLVRLAPSTEAEEAAAAALPLRESAHDPLTGLSTAAAFLERLRAAVRAAGRHRHPLSLAVLDVEAFGALNDRHGHLAGDEVLSTLSAAIRRALRAEDLAGRIQGDTFALAFPFTPAAGATAAVERLRSEIESMTFLDPGDGAPFRIRLRLAVVEQTTRKMEAEELLEAARARSRENV